MMWILLIAMFAIMYFFMIRPQNKKQKEIANFRKSLQVNQKVITAAANIEFLSILILTLEAISSTISLSLISLITP